MTTCLLARQATIGMRMTLLFLVVCLIKSGALEYYTAPRPYQAVNLPAASGAFFYRVVLHVLEHVEMFPALVAFVFVSRHCFSSLYVNRL